MGSLDDILPLPAARPIEADDALAATVHGLAALAAGIAAMQLLTAVALGDLLPAAFFGVVLLATGACAFAPDDRALRRRACMAGGTASVLVWLSIVGEASGASVTVAAVMVAGSVAATRAVVLRSERLVRPEAVANSEVPAPTQWITDDREGTLAA